MPSRKLSIAAVLSLTLLLLCVAAWGWSYVRGAPDAYDDASQKSYADHKALIEDGLKHATRLEQRSPELAASMRRVYLELQSSMRSPEDDPPFHWVRCRSSKHAAWYLVSSRGTLMLIRYAPEPTARATGEALVVAPGFWKVDGDTGLYARPAIPFGYRAYRSQGSFNGWLLNHRSWSAPYWLLCLLTLIVPSLWLLTRSRARRAMRRHRCVQCGYDLRASPERCPECGASPPGSRSQ